MKLNLILAALLAVNVALLFKDLGRFGHASMMVKASAARPRHSGCAGRLIPTSLTVVGRTLAGGQALIKVWAPVALPGLSHWKTLK